MTTDHATRLVADTLTSAALRFGVELQFDVDELFEQVVLDRALTRALIIAVDDAAADYGDPHTVKDLIFWTLQVTTLTFRQARNLATALDRIPTSHVN